jgi:hypothetical protein
MKQTKTTTTTTTTTYRQLLYALSLMLKHSHEIVLILRGTKFDI